MISAKEAHQLAEDIRLATYKEDLLFIEDAIRLASARGDMATVINTADLTQMCNGKSYSEVYDLVKYMILPHGFGVCDSHNFKNIHINW